MQSGEQPGVFRGANFVSPAHAGKFCSSCSGGSSSLQPANESPNGVAILPVRSPVARRGLRTATGSNGGRGAARLNSRYHVNTHKLWYWYHTVCEEILRCVLCVHRLLHVWVLHAWCPHTCVEHRPSAEHVTQLIIFFSSSHSFYVNAPLLRHTTIHHTHHNSTHANNRNHPQPHPQPLPQPRPSTTNRTHPQRPQSPTAPHSPAPHSPADSSRFLLRLNKFQKEYWDCKSVLYNRNMRVRRLVGEAVVKNPLLPFW